jgi:hypothetical protein
VLTAVLLFGTGFAAAPAQAALGDTVCRCTGGNGAFTHAAITVDGSLADWATIVTDAINGDPDNNVCDSFGGDNSEDAPHPDRDWLTQSTGRDLEQFAFTWDATNLYFYTRRYASTNNIQRFLYYGDLDGDGLMEGDGNAGSEIVIALDWQGNTGDVTVYKYYYLEASAGGDSVVDGGGFADGYDMPGKVRNGTTLRTGTWGATSGADNGVAVEFRVTWTELEVASGTPIAFHVSSLNTAINNNTPPNGVDDNMGGCGGGGGTLQFAGVDLDPPRSLSGLHNAYVCVAHAISNDGNDDDYFNITGGTLPSQVSAVEYRADNGTVGTYDGNATDPLLTDSAGDAGTDVDTGLLASGASTNILACYTIGFTNSYTPSGTGNHVVTATSDFNNVVTDSVTNDITVILVPALMVTKSTVAFTDPVACTDPDDDATCSNPAHNIPGSIAAYNITIQNNGGGAVDVDTVVIRDPIPTSVDLQLGGAGGPVTQTDGAVACGLTYTFTSLASATDDVSFSNDGGATWTYTPVDPDTDGFDPAVTHIRINPKGILVGQSAPTAPSCTWTFRVGLP